MSYQKHKDLALLKIESVLENLGVEYSLTGQNFVKIACPIHNSSTVGNSIIYLDTGVWMCFSGTCHVDNGKDILGLIRSCLSTDRDEPVKWSDVYNFIEKQEKISNLKVQKVEDRPMFLDESKKPIVRIPSLYFMKKRSQPYSADVLTEFEVGDCCDRFLRNRAIVPIRHVNNEYMGYTARSHWDCCKECGYYHNRYETCVDKNSDFKSLYNKWYNSKGLQKSKTLYGINKIKRTNKIAIVEGPGCVWRLWEYGIPAVSVLGKHFDNNRMAMIKSFGIDKVMLSPDKDKAGDEFRDRFIKDFHNQVEIFIPNLTAKDISDMPKNDIEKNVLRVWEKI